MILSEMVKSWIDRRALNLAPSTISGYNTLLRKYIQGTAVGAADVADLDEDDMIALLRPLLDAGHTRQTQLLQILVSAVLKDAVRRRVLAFNPMDSVEHIRHHSRPTAWLTVDQARQLLRVSQANGDPLFVAWLLMLCCGLRRGEVLGLRWTDIDWGRALLHVERQKITIEGRVIVTRPKSSASVREIPLDGHLLALLRLQRAGDGDILPGVTETRLHEGLDRALIAAGLPRVTLHGLRHSMAAVAAGEGVPIKILQGLMGHAHYTTTADIYAHVDQQPRRMAAESIALQLIGTRLEIV